MEDFLVCAAWALPDCDGAAATATRLRWCTLKDFEKIDIKAFVNTGANAFVAKTVPVSVAVWPEGEDIQFTSRAFRQSFAYDTDHDGRQELVVVLSKGSVISIPIRPDLGPGDPGTFIRIIGKVPPPGDYDKFIVSDIDRDGTQDVLFGDETWHVLFQHDQAAADRLKRVTDGMGRIDDVTYKAGRTAPYTPWGFVRDSSRTIRSVPPVVETHEVLEDTARAPVSVTTERFSYEEARSAFFGRGSLGFARVTRTLEADGSIQLTEVSSYDNVTYLAQLGQVVRHFYPFAGRMTSRERTYPPVASGIGGSTTTVRITERDEWNYQVSYSSVGLPFVYLQHDSFERLEVSDLSDPNRVWMRTHDYQVTPYGVVEETIDNLYSGGADLIESTIASNDYAFTGSDLTAVWPRRLPTTISTTSSRNDESVTRVVNRDYFPEGGLDYEENGSSEPSLHKRVAYQRNARGNVTFTTTQGTSSRVEQTLYDARGEFAETEINALGHQSTNAWYKGYGILAAHQDPNGLTSQTIIDGFGRTLYSTDSQGNATITSYWSDVPTLDFLKARTKLIEKRTQAGIDTFTYLDPFARKIGTEVSTQKGYLETAFGYDKLGRMVWATSRPFAGGTVPASNVTTYTRDAMGRVTQIRYPNDAGAGGFSQVTYSYGTHDWPDPEIGPDLIDQGASVVERKYPGGATEVELLDAAGRRLALRDRAGAVSTIRYGAFGFARQIRDAGGVSLTVSYDALGRQTGTTDPIRGNSTTTYSSGR